MKKPSVMTVDAFTDAVVSRVHKKLDKAAKDTPMPESTARTWAGLLSAVEQGIQRRSALFAMEQDGAPVFSLTPEKAKEVADVYSDGQLGSHGIIGKCLRAIQQAASEAGERAEDRPVFLSAALWANAPPPAYGENIAHIFSRDLEKLDMAQRQEVSEQIQLPVARLNQVVSDMRVARVQVERDMQHAAPPEKRHGKDSKKPKEKDAGAHRKHWAEKVAAERGKKDKGPVLH